MEAFPVVVMCYRECLRAQCWVLGCFLFYINDLPQNLSSDCRLFADDILLYNIRENHKILQNDLNELEEWGKLWQLAFNNSKCSVLSLRTNYINNSRLWNFLNHPYGIELSYDLKWEKHITNITAKVSRTLGMLSRVLKMADTRTRQLVYKTLVRPILEFGCQVWDPYLWKMLNNWKKFKIELKGRVSFSQIRRDTSITSLKDRRKELRHDLFVNLIESGVVDDKHSNSPEKVYNTRQQKKLYSSSIRTKAYFQLLLASHNEGVERQRLRPTFFCLRLTYYSKFWVPILNAPPRVLSGNNLI